jgi:hypothetical protein
MAVAPSGPGETISTNQTRNTKNLSGSILRVVFVTGNPSPDRMSNNQPQYFNILSTFIFQVEKPIISKFFPGL